MPKLVNIGKGAAKNRLAAELLDEVLRECKVCQCEKAHTYHMPVSACKGCKAPRDHHAYQPRGGEAYA